MNIIQLDKTIRHGGGSIIGFVDLQREYTAQGRAYCISEADKALGNCSRLLDKARECGSHIAHFRQILPTAYFNSEGPFSGWIEEFRPRANELVYERGFPSCYANESFSAFVGRIDNPVLILAGLGGDRGCLATAVDAMSRGHRIILVTDAIATQEIGDLSEVESHNFLINLVSQYADLYTIDEAINFLDKIAFSQRTGST